MIRKWSLVIVLLMLAVLDARGQSDIRGDLKISVSDDETMWSGEQIMVNLDLMTTGFSFANTHFNLPGIPGAFLLQIDSTTIKLTDQIDGETWQIIRYPLALITQSPGELTVPSFEVRFTASAGFGTEPASFKLMTEPVIVNISQPPGVRPGTVIVTTTSYRLEHSWEGAGDALKPGDAFNLEVNQSAANTSGMLLPPLPELALEGLAAYPDAPLIEDATDRGDIVGKRTDKITWIAETAGQYQIPSIRYQWWNPEQETLETQTVRGLEIEVLDTGSNGVVAADPAFSGLTRRLPGWFWPLMLAVGAVGALAWWRWGTRLVQWWSQRKATYKNSEAFAFKLLTESTRKNDPKAAYRAVTLWLVRCFPGRRSTTLSRLAVQYHLPALEKESEALQLAMLEDSSNWDGQPLLLQLKQLRKSINQGSQSTRNPLSELNPRARA